MHIRKLHIFKERQLHEGSEQDLRGFGTEEVFKNFWPTVVLTQVGGNLKIDMSIMNHFNACIADSKHKGFTHITLANKPNGSHKLDAIKLFILALKLANQADKSIKYLLWQTNSFRHVLHHSITSSKPSTKPTLDNTFDPKLLSGSEFLKVISPVHVYLGQAGFNDVNSELEYEIFSHERAIHCLKNEFAAMVGPAQKLG